jgi:uncharacterized cysteine cluster protein YcgN (CxxCxxCC family)
MSLRLHVMVTKNSDIFVPNDCSYGQLAKIQNFYLSLRLWSNRERLLTFQLLNSRESKFGDICGDKCLGIIISLLDNNTKYSNTFPQTKNVNKNCIRSLKMNLSKWWRKWLQMIKGRGFIMTQVIRFRMSRRFRF